MRTLVFALVAVVFECQGAESFILPQMTAARETNAVVCLLTWVEVPKEYQVVAYRVYQAEAVGGPFVRVAQTTTNELLFVVEPGKHFWKVVAVNLWNAEGEPSVVLEAPPVVPEVGGVSMKKVKAGGGRERAAAVEMPPEVPEFAPYMPSMSADLPAMPDASAANGPYMPALPGTEAGTVDPGVLMDTGWPVTRSRIRTIPSRAKLPKDEVTGEKQETKD